MIYDEILFEKAEILIESPKFSLNLVHKYFSQQDFIFYNYLIGNLSVLENFEFKERIKHSNILEIFQCSYQKLPTGIYEIQILADYKEKLLSEFIKERMKMNDFLSEKKFCLFMNNLITPLIFLDLNGFFFKRCYPL